MKITYQPTAHDPDVVDVAGISFKAFEPVEVENGDIATKLKKNPWFTDGEIDPDRHDAWAKVRAAQIKAKEHRDEAARLERENSL